MTGALIGIYACFSREAYFFLFYMTNWPHNNVQPLGVGEEVIVKSLFSGNSRICDVKSVPSEMNKLCYIFGLPKHFYTI